MSMPSDAEDTVHEMPGRSLQTEPERAPPLVVDVDGTLIRSDLLVESLFQLLAREPAVFWRLPLWLARGRSAFKSRIADHVVVDPRTLPLVESLLDSLGKDKIYKSLLDIGCGYGNHLALAEKRGWDCFGIEILDHARKVAMNRHSPQIVVVESIDDLIPRAHDLILLLDVIEHLPDPYPLFYELFAKGAIQLQKQSLVAYSEGLSSPLLFFYSDSKRNPCQLYRNYTQSNKQIIPGQLR